MSDEVCLFPSHITGIVRTRVPHSLHPESLMFGMKH